MDYRQYKLLTFDTYGTLIDWESGVVAAAAPVLSRLATPPSRDAVLETFGRVEHQLQMERPRLIYSKLLDACLRAMAAEWGVEATDAEAAAFGRSVKDWPAFEDSAAALKRLRARARLATLTNCDRISYMGSNARLEIEWDGVITAQDVGSYKPDLRNFDVMFEWARTALGVLPHEILHVAQSLTHDMIPATKRGMTKVWIDRRHSQEGFGATAPPVEPYTVEATFPSMAAFTDAFLAGTG